MGIGDEWFDLPKEMFNNYFEMLKKQLSLLCNFNLPCQGFVSSSMTAFSIENTGGGSAGSFKVDNIKSSNPALYVENSGDGPALTAKISKISYSGNTKPALEAINEEGLAAKFKGNVDVEGEISIKEGAMTLSSQGIDVKGDGVLASFKSKDSRYNYCMKVKADYGDAIHVEAPSGTALVAKSPGRAIDVEGSVVVNGRTDYPSLEVKGDHGNAISAKATSGTALVVSSPHIAIEATGTVVIYGNIGINGTLSKFAGGFLIDHPLDPENKVLRHSFVESPDMKNIYDGIVTLDERGEAIVKLPDYFEALNKDFRYQLTSVGVSSPGLYIMEEVKDNTFKIGGGEPGQKVSWLITGIRKDTYALEHPIIVEEDKQDN